MIRFKTRIGPAYTERVKFHARRPDAGGIFETKHILRLINRWVVAIDRTMVHEVLCGNVDARTYCTV